MPDRNDGTELIRRFAGNPILRPEDFPDGISAVFNPGAVVVDGQTLLLVRVEDQTGHSSLIVATSDDGLTNWQVDPERGLSPQRDTYTESGGIEDARITVVGADYYVAYTGYSSDGPLVCLARTRDFRDWERLGGVLRPDDKDAALFSVKFGDRWAMLHRPGTSKGSHIWLSKSPDLRHWGDSTVLLTTRRGGWWDNSKIGLGPQPLLTRDGWLLCYHGVRITASGAIYRAGLALLDRDDPAKVLARADNWLLGPEESYERHGDVPNVVFPCGWVLRDDQDTLHIYYGAADTVVCAAQASVSELLDYLARYRGLAGPQL